MPAASNTLLRLFLIAVLFLPLLICGCAEDDSDDLVPPDLTLDALAPDPFNSERTLTGTVGPGATVGISVDTNAVVGEVAVADGRWEVTISDLAPGLNSVLVFAQNEFNTRTLQISLVYNIVQVDQVRTVTHLPDTTVLGRLQTGGTIDEVRLNGVALDLDTVRTQTGDLWSLALTGLTAGANRVEIDATGSDGDSQKAVLTITYNGDVVEMTIDDLPRPPVLTTDQLVLTGTVEAGAEVVVSSTPEATFDTPVYDPITDDWQVTVSDLAEGTTLFQISGVLEGTVSASGEARVEVDTLPVVESVFPDPDDTTPAAIDTTVSAVFDQAMVGSTVNEESFILHVGVVTGTPVAGTVTYDAAAKKAIFTPDAPLEPSTPYVAEVTGAIEDPAGNPIDTDAGLPAEWTFTTAAE